MAILSNENVSVGDRVYDIARGEGSVVDIAFDDIVVRFNNGTRITFDKHGNYGGVRRLYWHNPVIIEPTKENAKWRTLTECIKAVASYLGG